VKNTIHLSVLLSTVLLVLLVPGTIFADQNDFYFVQITDTHWGENHNEQRTKEAIDNINALSLPVEFVAHTGDITVKTIEDQAFMDKMLAIMRTCKYPVYYLPGNHDISFDRFDETVKAYVKNFGPINNRREVHNVTIITLYNFKVKGAYGKTLYDPLVQLDSLFKGKSEKLPVILFQHDPTVQDFFQNQHHPGWPEEDRIKLQQLCEKNNVQAVICGHFHRDEFHWLGQIPLFVSAPIAKKGGRQATFRVYHYENGKVSYFTQYF
jgi:predicted MPP superfamily phosphohydrolase